MRAPKGQSLQTDGSVQPTSDNVYRRNCVKRFCDHIFYNSAIRVSVVSVPMRPAVSSSGDSSRDVVRMPSALASAKLGKVPESQELSEQWSQMPERTYLSPEACLFIPGCVEHGCDGAVRATSKQGQSSDGQHSLVSKCLPSDMLLQTYECMITLS